MLWRKIEAPIRDHLASGSDQIILLEGARQTGKSFIIRHIGRSMFQNYIELNMSEDKNDRQLFSSVRSVTDFYLRLGMLAGDRLGDRDNTLIFIDEIQEYEQLLTLLKFLRQDGRYTYIASGSLLGVTLRRTTSIPIGSIRRMRMYPLDFEEFLVANGFNLSAIDALHGQMLENEAPDNATHERMLELFRRYLLSGGLPDAVNAFIRDQNIVTVRNIQDDIHSFYADDAAKYEAENSRRLKIRSIYSLIPSNMENRKKRIVAQAIEGKKGKRFSDYEDEFEYLINAGITIPVQAIPTPVFPLAQSVRKNLIKLYLNDVGILTGILYQRNIRAILDDERSINLGSVYETIVAQELYAHGHELCYYDNRDHGEVDFLIDDFDKLSVVPIEVKSGKDYTVHSALTRFLNNDDYHIHQGIVLSNACERRLRDGVRYLPIYDVMFL